MADEQTSSLIMHHLNGYEIVDQYARNWIKAWEVQNWQQIAFKSISVTTASGIPPLHSDTLTHGDVFIVIATLSKIPIDKKLTIKAEANFSLEPPLSAPTTSLSGDLLTVTYDEGTVSSIDIITEENDTTNVLTSVTTGETPTVLTTKEIAVTTTQCSFQMYYSGETTKWGAGIKTLATIIANDKNPTTDAIVATTALVQKSATILYTINFYGLESTSFTSGSQPCHTITRERTTLVSTLGAATGCAIPWVPQDAESDNDVYFYAAIPAGLGTPTFWLQNLILSATMQSSTIDGITYYRSTNQLSKADTLLIKIQFS